MPVLHIVDERVQETTIATGAGALLLAGASPGFLSFAGAGFVDGATFWGLIENTTTGVIEKELTKCTWTTGGIITRAATVANGFRKSSTGSPISFTAGTKTISVVALANSGNHSIREIVSGATYQMAANDCLLLINKTAAGVITVTLKENPQIGDQAIIVDKRGDAATNSITIDAFGAGTINGAANVALNIDRATFVLEYTGTEWTLISVV